MTANAGFSKLALASATTLVVALAVGAPTHAVPADAVDVTASVDLIDDAIGALEDGDDDAYDRLVDAAQRGDVWLPGSGVDALFDRDTENLAYLSNVLDSPDLDLYDWASDAVAYELSALRAIPPDGSASTLEQADDIADADELGFAMLEILDHRAVAVSAVVRAVLAPLDVTGARTPGDAVYEEAITELDRLYESGASEPEPEPEPEPEAVVPVPAPTLAPTPDAAATPAVTSEASTPDATPTVALAPAPPSGENNNTLILAAMGLAVVAIIVGLVTAMRGRKHGQLADIAYTDGLTGLKNRRRMDVDIAEQQTRNRSTATLMVDVDHFKKFNDVHGHAIGDEVLRLVGDTLSREFRRTDVPYRYGGEEFCVLLPDTTETEAVAAGERVRAAIAAIELPVEERVTASVGVSIGPATSITETIERADSALYTAKENGRNQVALA